jgi:hypothetical protein
MVQRYPLFPKLHACKQNLNYYSSILANIPRIISLSDATLFVTLALPKLVRIGKKRKNSFVLLPTFRNFATLCGELTRHSEEKTNVFVLFFARLFVTLQAKLKTTKL